MLTFQILLYYNFQETPENMMEILSELTSLSPKVVKVSAGGPYVEQDVLDLMHTRGFKTLSTLSSTRTISHGENRARHPVSLQSGDAPSWSLGYLMKLRPRSDFAIKHEENQGDLDDGYTRLAAVNPSHSYFTFYPQ